MQYGDRITRFMGRIAAGKRIYVVLSSKYLHSLYCMYELFSIWRHKRSDEQEFLDAIKVVRLPCARISGIDARGLEARLSIARYWYDEYQKQKKLIADNLDLVGERAFANYRFTRDIALNIEPILDLFADTLTPQGIDSIEQLVIDCDTAENT